jgi:hypothetical protein
MSTSDAQLEVIKKASKRTIDQLADAGRKIVEEGVSAEEASGKVDEALAVIGLDTETVSALSQAFTTQVQQDPYEAFCNGFLTAINVLAVQSEEAVA